MVASAKKCRFFRRLYVPNGLAGPVLQAYVRNDYKGLKRFMIGPRCFVAAGARRRKMTGSRIWWGILVAAFALALVPVHAQESDDATDAAEVDESSSTSDAVFEYLVAELAAQRGDTEGALEIYQRLARELHDPQVARRAVELAIRARLYPKALESASLLLQLDADATLAREIMAALLANEGDIKKATATLADIVDKANDRGSLLMHLSHLFGKFNDKAQVLDATKEIAGRYEDMAEAHYAIGVAALVAGNNDLALEEV